MLMDRECICKIRDIYRNIAAFEALLQRQLQLNINEAMLLCVVSERENISSGEIAEEMNLTPSNASKVIASLENKSLIKPKQARNCFLTSHATRFSCPKRCKA